MRPIQSNYLLTCLVLVCCNCCAGIAVAQNVAPLQLQIVDANDNGIEGVEIKIGSLVFAGNSGLSLALNDLKTVDGGPLQVDSEGSISVAIPDVQLGDLARCRLNVRHPNFAEFNEWIDVEVKQLNKVTLSRGVRIAVTAIDADSGSKLIDNLYVIAEQKDLDQMVDWKSNGKGLLISRPLRTTDKRIRLVELVDGKAIRFSDPIDVPAEEGERTVVKDVPVSKSLAFSGKLHSDVPRPIRNGMIAVCITWPTKTEMLETTGPIGHWLAHTPIAEDGSFEVTGLPSGAWIQVIASCDGWFNKPSQAELRERVCPSENKWLNIEDSILPSLFEFSSSVTGAVIEMQPTVSASVRFVHENDTPFANAKFRAQRSQRFLHSSWDYREFRSQRSTADELVAVRQGDKYRSLPGESIVSQTDDKGIASVVGIPGSKFLIQIEGFPLEDGRLWKSIDLDDRDERPITVKQKLE